MEGGSLKKSWDRFLERMQECRGPASNQFA